MEVSPEYRYLQPRLGLALLFRIAGMGGIAGLALIFPEVGEHRYLLAGALLFFCAPLAIWLNLRIRGSDNGWVEPLFDLFATVCLIHFVPDVWIVALCIGLMVAMAPSISLHPRSYRFYGLFAVVLVGGMGLAAILHDVQGWHLPLMSVAAIYPSVIFYAHWQVRRANALRERAQLLQSMTHLAGSVAHDFNNVLAGVTGHAELALADLPDEHPANAAVQEVINGASRASLLCGQLLSFSKLAPGSQHIDLEKELGMLVGLLEPVVPKGVVLDLAPTDGSFWVNADRSRLQQVLMNVILNAGEACTKLPGLVSLSLHEEKRDERTWVAIQVRDSGDGIAAEDIERVFDPFYTTKEKGHGLGLAGAQRIMQAHGGEIGISSQIGIGTTVTLRFPLAPPGLEKEPENGELSGGKGGLVLIVDDEDSVREVVSGLLSRVDYDCISVQDGQEAIETFRRRADEVVAVVLDLKMPGMDGWRCLELLREIRADVPILVCSGYDPEDREVGALPPNVRFLSKPFRNADLQAALIDIAS